MDKEFKIVKPKTFFEFMIVHQDINISINLDLPTGDYILVFTGMTKLGLNMQWKYMICRDEIPEIKECKNDFEQYICCLAEETLAKLY